MFLFVIEILLKRFERIKIVRLELKIVLKQINEN
jgi:hypothetical protein